MKSLRNNDNQNSYRVVGPPPTGVDPDKSYGIIQMPQPDDILYKIIFDCQTSELKLGKTCIIKRFQWEEDGDNIFRALYCSELNKDKVKEIELPKKGMAYSLINNIKMPLNLRKAIFKTSKNGKKLQVHTEISRERAKAFKVSEKEVQSYVLAKYHETNKH